MALPVARALDALLSQRTPETRMLRECWMELVLHRGGRAPAFSRLCREGDFLTASLLADEISAVMPGQTATSLRYFLSEFPSTMPGPRFPRCTRDLDAARHFARDLPRLI